MKICFVFVLNFFALLSAPSIATAWRCELPPFGKTEKQIIKLELEKSVAVFSGEVTEIILKQTIPNEEAPVAEVRFKVFQSWKGVETSTVTVFTANICCICGYNFKVGESYLVYNYASDKNGNLWTGMCTRTKSLSEAVKDLKVLGKGKSFKNQNKNVLPDSVKSGGKIGTGENDAWLGLKIRSMLLSNDEMRGAEIVLDVTDAKVILRGKVENKAQKTKAEQLAWSMEGVKAVTTNLEIASPK